MKKALLMIVALGSLASMPVHGGNVVSRVLKGHGFDLGQAAVIHCLAHGISAERVRLDRPLGNVISNNTFRFFAALNLGRAVVQALYHEIF